MSLVSQYSACSWDQADELQSFFKIIYLVHVIIGIYINWTSLNCFFTVYQSEWSLCEGVGDAADSVPPSGGRHLGLVPAYPPAAEVVLHILPDDPAPACCCITFDKL